MSDQNEVQYILEDNSYVFNCPHCENPVQVQRDQVNCQIFRHGQMKNTYDLRFASGAVGTRVSLANMAYAGVFLTLGDQVQARQSNEADFEQAVVLAVNEGQQVNPHAPQAHCDRLAANGLIWGCGKPFRLIRNNENYVIYVAKCGYV